MAVVSKYTCDACGTIKEVRHTTTPSDWSQVNMTVEGLPSYLSAGTKGYYLCHACVHEVTAWFKEQSWLEGARARDGDE